jgi:UDP-N-acetylglucosamine--N-acetylmuramyl-(pentapeptide) pyrophosphoryl-undecaprenol N-acetylglucosamine transferase
MKKKALISVGGTGGHIYPAIALAQQLKKSTPALELLFIGGNLSSNRFFQGAGMPHRAISCGALSPNKPLQSLTNLGKIIKGIWESKQVISQFQPDIMIGFGSYHTFPTMIAAMLSKVPFLLHASDSIPGKVIRLFSKYAIATSIHFPSTAQWLYGNSVHVSMPLREGFKFGLYSKEYARAYFQLEENCRTILIFGGSQGAAFLNHLIVEVESSYFGGFQVIHITGNKEASATLREKYRQAGVRAAVKEFEPRMELAWQAADCVISRAGAATIAEQLEFEVPGILIPYPHAAENHQEKNALFMSETVGCAQMILEAHFNKDVLKTCFQDQQKLLAMQEAIRLYKKKYKPRELCSLVLEQLDRGN